MSYIIGLISGIFSGVLSSIIAQIIFLRSKPKLTISDSISKSIVTDHKTQKQHPEYKIKIINNSKYYVKSLKIYTRLIKTNNIEGGINLVIYPIKIVYSNIDIIDPYDSNDADARYAIKIRLVDNLEELWIDDTYYLEIKIYCENAINNSGKVFIKEYRTKKSIKEGSFKANKSLDIL